MSSSLRDTRKRSRNTSPTRSPRRGYHYRDSRAGDGGRPSGYSRQWSRSPPRSRRRSPDTTREPRNQEPYRSQQQQQQQSIQQGYRDDGRVAAEPAVQDEDEPELDDWGSGGSEDEDAVRASVAKRQQRQQWLASVAEPVAAAEAKPAPPTASHTSTAAAADAGAMTVHAAGQARVRQQESPRTADSVENSGAADDAGSGDVGFDMFKDDDVAKLPSLAQAHAAGRSSNLKRGTDAHLHDNWHDPDGYYLYQIGERIDDRYLVIGSHGKGMFSTVLLCKDTQNNGLETAIKVVRASETMIRAGEKEMEICRRLSEADPHRRHHCIQLLRNFEYRGHLCMVFENMHQDLRSILRKFGRDIGLSIQAVQMYARQLFIALRHLRRCGILHADVKPDNILVNEKKNVLKLADFGSAFSADENSPTPLLVSRYYRAPEIILGIEYSYGIDMWAVGVTLFELYTGRFLFPGEDNNDMLRLIQQLRGRISNRLIKKGVFRADHFTQDYLFLQHEADPLDSSSEVAERRLVLQLKDLLERILVVDPAKRMTVDQALHHPFIQSEAPSQG